jgi:hypothetical protein
MSTPFVLLAMKFLSVFDSTLSYMGMNAPATMFGIFSNQQMFFIILLFIVIAMVLHGGFNPEVHNSTEIGKVASYL